MIFEIFLRHLKFHQFFKMFWRSHPSFYVLFEVSWIPKSLVGTINYPESQLGPLLQDCRSARSALMARSISTCTVPRASSSFQCQGPGTKHPCGQFPNSAPLPHHVPLHWGRPSRAAWSWRLAGPAFQSQIAETHQFLQLRFPHISLPGAKILHFSCSNAWPNAEQAFFNLLFNSYGTNMRHGEIRRLMWCSAA